MHATRLSLVIILFLPTVTALDVTFAPPGAVDGHVLGFGLQRSGFIMAPGAMTAELRHAVGGQGWNHTSDFAWESKPGFSNITLLAQDRDTVGPFAVPDAVDFRSSNGPASFLFDAKSIAVDLVSRTAIRTYAGEGPAGDVLQAPPHSYRMPNLNPADVFVRPEAPRTALHLVAHGVTRIEWFNVQPRCADGPCLEKGGRTYSRTEAAAGHGIATETASFVEVTLQSGELDATFDSSDFFAEAPIATLQVNGTARLPLAEGSTTCSSCTMPDGKTLTVAGTVYLANIASDSRGRLRTSLGGNVSAAALDEQRVAPSAILGFSPAAVATVAATAVGLGLALALRFLLVLLSKRRGPPDHVRRTHILEYIQGHGGCTLADVCQATGIPRTPARHHLLVLARTGKVVEHRQGQHVRFFPAGERPHPEWERALLLEHPEMRRLHDWIGAHPRFNQKEILATFEGYGQRPNVTRWRLDRLVHAGFVIPEPAGRARAYVLKAQGSSAWPQAERAVSAGA